MVRPLALYENLRASRAKPELLRTTLALFALDHDGEYPGGCRAMVELRQSAVRLRAESGHTPVFSYARPALVADNQAKDLPQIAAARDFIDELYVSAIEFSRLSSALMNLARAFDAEEACLFMKEWPSAKLSVLEKTPSAENHGRAAYFDSIDLVDDLENQLVGRSEVYVGSVATVHAGTRKRTPVADRVHYLAVAPDIASQSFLGLAIARGGSPFAEHDREQARALVPDIARALELRKRAGRIEAIGFGIQMFDQNPIAIIVARQRVIERANAAAAALLASARPIGAASGKLQFEDARAQAAFELLSRSDGQSSPGQSFAFVVEGAGDRTWIVQLSHARPTLALCGAGQPPAILVALTPFNAASETRETMLNGFTDLTPTERTIFAAFVDGCDIAAIAQRLNRSVETVRWHVRNLFTKLGVNSQADLARLGALLLPL